MVDVRKNLFGRLVLDTGMVSEEELRSVLEEQEKYRKAGKEVPRMGELLAHKGLLTVEQVKRVLRKQREESLSEVANIMEDAWSEEDQDEQTSPSDEVGSQEQEPSGSKAEDVESSRSIRYKPGNEVFGHYKIQRLLGENLSYVTYKAYDNKSEHTVILQMPRFRAARDSEFISEAEEHVFRAAKLKHPNIQCLLSAAKVDGQLYFTAEYSSGVSLRKLLSQRGSIAPELALHIALGVASALDHGHEHGIYHQEISPSCILITPDGDVKLAGFGRVSRPVRNIEDLIRVVGDTPFYLAPEQISGGDDAEPDERTDLYSLGAVLYHAVSGQPLYSGENLESILLDMAQEDPVPLGILAPEVPESFRNIIEKLIQGAPEDRYQSAGELLIDLANVEEIESSKVRADTATLKAANEESAFQATPPNLKKKEKTGTAVRRKRVTGKIPYPESRTEAAPGEPEPSASPRRGRRRSRGDTSRMSPTTLILCLVFLAGLIGAGAYFIPRLLAVAEGKNPNARPQRERIAQPDRGGTENSSANKNTEADKAEAGQTGKSGTAADADKNKGSSPSADRDTVTNEAAGKDNNETDAEFAARVIGKLEPLEKIDLYSLEICKPVKTLTERYDNSWRRKQEE